MSSNPFLQWPLWHYFTLHFQNLESLGADISLIRPILTPILLDDDKVSIVSGATDEDSMRGGETLVRRKNDIVVYDFIEDKIRRLSSFHDPVYVYTIKAYKDLATKPSHNSLIMIKGGKSNANPKGGDLLPFIGRPNDMVIMPDLITAAITGQPYDLWSKFDNMKRAEIEALLSRSIYSTPSIKAILTSYKTCNVSKTEDTNLINNIAKRITMYINGKTSSGKAINLETGSFSNTKHDKLILEFKVRLVRESQPVNVKFSLPQDIPSTRKEFYIDLLKKNFFAEQIHTPAIEERRATEFNPVTIESSTISSIFGEPEKFSKYIAKVNAIEKVQSLNPTVTLSSLPAKEEEEEEEETFEED